ncbi:MAG: hypothetical protein J6K03_02765, partial [Oscillospiraceae bacterium]|nr:hypothetical protein [Oscillospiraceae bacterium]
MMMKKIYWLLVITLLLGCLAACQSTGTSNNDQLTKSMKEEIDQAWENGNRMPYGEWYDDGFSYGPRYYGTENGYAFIFVQANIAAAGRCVIGKYTFRSGQSFNLYGYKDGVFHLVSDLYNQGLISDATVK